MNKILRFEITDRCNQKCDMCWSTEWHHNDMTWSQIKKLILEYNDLFPHGTIVLTSREPLLSPCFRKMLQLCKKLDIELKLLTNGTLFTDEMCDIIVNSTINFISISIHGDKTYHNIIVKNRFSYTRIINGIHLINKYKKKYHRDDLEIRITSVINNNLLNSIEQILNVVYQNDLTFRLQHLMWHSLLEKEQHKVYLNERYGMMDNSIDGFLDHSNMTANTVIDIITKVKMFASTHSIKYQIYPCLNDNDIKIWYESNISDLKNSYCDHIQNSIRVRSNGDIVLCQYIEKIMGNIQKQSLKEIVCTDKYNNIINDVSNHVFPICNHCCHCKRKNQIVDKTDIKNEDI